MSFGAPLTDNPGAPASKLSSFFCAAAADLPMVRVGGSPRTFGVRFLPCGGASDLSAPERGEAGGESGVDAPCRPLRLLDELDELLEGPGLEDGLNKGKPPLLPPPCAVGSPWRGMPEVNKLDRLEELTGEGCVLVGANGEGGLVVGPNSGGGLVPDPPPFPVSIGGGRLDSGGFAPDGGGVLRREEGDVCVLENVVVGALLGTCGEGAWLDTAGWRRRGGGEDSGLCSEVAEELDAGAVAVFSLGAAKGESGGLFFGRSPPPP